MRVFAILLLSVATAIPAPAQDRPRPRPVEERCASDGSDCIRLASFVQDVCRVIEDAATEHGIDTGYFARLLWQESLFDPGAVSPAGAQGIAQFMPGTAALRGLQDPFNPVDAIRASAEYLAELTDRFGNLGLAAAAYNSGEARTTDFLNADRTLPGETRAYVQIITGHSARTWRDDTPKNVDFALSPGIAFRKACTEQAATRGIKSFKPAAPPPSWGVVVAAGRRRATVERFAAQVEGQYGWIIGDRDVEITEKKIPGFGRNARLAAVVRARNADDARALCRQLQRQRAYCTVTGPGV